ncbi:MAG: electron transfer flavoprotein subunit beta/FixA family protein [Candidatus Melainabacteria bacterium]|nr:electron transfer flavoprotein subunit beta/FixA family protein [Candidatus Melainabacteria bacterium]
MPPSPTREILVLIKQVPDQNAKAGVNPDGTIDRARAKRMLNPFDRYALQAALHIKKTYGGRVTAITMGPPPAEEILLEAIAHGVDAGVLLSDRRLAASDTLATSYALTRVIEHLGAFDFIFCGLQTTDGDTAQVGPEIAERLNIPHVSYCEDFRLEQTEAETALVAKRIIEAGYQWIKMKPPALITVANSYPALEYQSIRGARQVQQLQRDAAAKANYIRVVNLDDVQADPQQCGLIGSPTIVGRTWKIAEMGGSCQMQQGAPVEQMVQHVFQQANIRELVRA